MKKVLGMVVTLALAASANAQFLGSGPGIAITDNASANSVINVPNNFAITGIAVALQGARHSWVGDLTITLLGPNGQTATIMQRPGVGVGTSTVGSSRDFGTATSPQNYRFTDRFGAQNFSAIGATDISLAAAGTPGGNIWSAAGVTGAPAPVPTALLIAGGDYIASGNNGGGSYATAYIENNLLAILGSQSQGDWRLTIADGAAGDTGAIDGWQLQLLPEPTTMSLIGLGIVGLLRRRR